MKLDHINIRTTDLPAMIQFLGDTAGLTVGDRPPFNFPGAWLYDDDGAAVHLVEVEKTDPIGMVDHFAVFCEGLETTRARLEDGGYKYTERAVPATNRYQLFVNGPEGLKIELLFDLDAT